MAPAKLTVQTGATGITTTSMRRRSPALLSQADTTQKRNAPQTIRNRDAVSVIAPASGRSSGPSGKQNGRQFQSQNCAREARSARNGHLQRSRHEIDSDCSYARNSRTDFSPFPEVSAGLENSALNSVSAFRRRPSDDASARGRGHRDRGDAADRGASRQGAHLLTGL